MAKALIVTGDETVRYLCEMAIKFQKIEVAAAKTVKEAVGKIEKFLPDLVIMDLETIDLSEVELLKKLKKPQKELPLIIITEMKAAEAKKRACVLGVCHVLAKTESTVGEVIKKARKTVKV